MKTDTLRSINNPLATMMKAVEQCSSIIILTSVEGIILYVNERFISLTGYSREEAIGQRPQILRSGKTSPELYKEMWKTIGAGSEWRGEIVNKKKNGEFYWESLSITPIYEEGKVTHYLAVAEDITDKKRLEEELHESLSQLKKANEELDSFASVVSHDLQGPIATVSLALDTIEENCDDKLDSISRVVLEKAKSALAKSQALISDLLSLSRATNRNIKKTSVDLDGVLNNVVSSLYADIEASRAVIHNRGLPMVQGQELLLRELFQNLISNAIKYRGNNTPEITVESKLEENFYHILVSDNGIGVEESEIVKIFDPFVRGSNGLKRDGTGLGLALCKKVAELHGGEIWAESGLGRGTRVHLKLPRLCNPSQE